MRMTTIAFEVPEGVLASLRYNADQFGSQTAARRSSQMV